jgi:hypothetical protein
MLLLVGVAGGAFLIGAAVGGLLCYWALTAIVMSKALDG